MALVVAGIAGIAGIAGVAGIAGIAGIAGVAGADARLARQLEWWLVLDDGIVRRDKSLRHALP
ncbi:hypothetical protein ACFY20_16725 [Streptomyces sp. NPDC001312]|uniref:hypothetical protein n=1 Tax=Streptomyces sp. NPDC001312 TaxID=3364561 RepID=UPI00367D00E0